MKKNSQSAGRKRRHAEQARRHAKRRAAAKQRKRDEFQRDQAVGRAIKQLMAMARLKQHLSPEATAAIEEGLAQAEAGEFVPAPETAPKTEGQ
jgi:hypothetical protein